MLKYMLYCGEMSRDKIKRMHTALTSKFEKQLLEKIAGKLPLWITPDFLTLIALLAALAIGISFVLGPVYRNAYLLAILFFAIHWFGDSLDGTVARVRKKQRPRYGHYIDHMLDSISLFTILGAITLSGLTGTSIWMWVLAGAVLIFIEGFLFSSVSKEFHLSFGMIGPTEGRIFGIILCLILYFFGSPELTKLTYLNTTVNITLMDAIGFFATFVVWSILLWKILTTAYKLHKEDTKNWE